MILPRNGAECAAQLRYSQKNYKASDHVEQTNQQVATIPESPPLSKIRSRHVRLAITGYSRCREDGLLDLAPQSSPSTTRNPRRSSWLPIPGDSLRWMTASSKKGMGHVPLRGKPGLHRPKPHRPAKTTIPPNIRYPSAETIRSLRDTV